MKNETAFYANLIMANIWMAAGNSDGYKIWSAVFIILAGFYFLNNWLTRNKSK